MNPVGLDIIVADYLADGTVMQVGSRLLIGTRPLTVRELAGAEGRYIVRMGLADVLCQLGQEVGPPPMRSGRGAGLFRRLRDLADGRYIPGKGLW